MSEVIAEPIAAGDIRLYYDPPGCLRMTVADDRSYPAVKLFLAWPLVSTRTYLSLQDSKGEEIVMLDRLEDLPAESQRTAEEELRRRYLTARIQRVTSVRTEFGVTYWDVETDRGVRDFVVQSVSESCLWLTPRHLVIVDVDGNRFEIQDMQAMDADSRRWLDSVL